MPREGTASPQLREGPKGKRCTFGALVVCRTAACMEMALHAAASCWKNASSTWVEAPPPDSQGYCLSSVLALLWRLVVQSTHLVSSSYRMDRRLRKLTPPAHTATLSRLPYGAFGMWQDRQGAQVG